MSVESMSTTERMYDRMDEMSIGYSFGVWKTHRSLPVTGRPLQGAPSRVSELHMMTSGAGTEVAIR
jgi:hypothetical protein